MTKKKRAKIEDVINKVSEDQYKEIRNQRLREWKAMSRTKKLKVLMEENKGLFEVINQRRIQIQCILMLGHELRLIGESLDEWVPDDKIMLEHGDLKITAEKLRAIASAWALYTYHPDNPEGKIQEDEPKQPDKP